MRQKIVAGNWKMNLDFNQGITLFNQIADLIKMDITGRQQAIICSPFIHLQCLAKIAAFPEHTTKNIAIGAQNAHDAESGAYTGEVSADMLASIGVSYVILGHSERRQYFGETNALLAKKTDMVLKHGLKPIFCIGETLQERESGKHFDIIKSQLEEGVFHLTADDFAKLVIAYEPVWAIGTGVTASAGQAQEVHAFIRAQIAAKYSTAVAEGVTILYGGSCNPKNAPELFSKRDIDGGLIGGASLKARDFVDILKVWN